MKKKVLLALIEEQRREIADLKRRIDVLEAARWTDAGKITVIPWVPAEPQPWYIPDITWTSDGPSDPAYTYFEMTNTNGDRTIGHYPNLPAGTTQVFSTC